MGEMKANVNGEGDEQVVSYLNLCGGHNKRMKSYFVLCLAVFALSSIASQKAMHIDSLCE